MTYLNMVCNVTGGLQRDGLAWHGAILGCGHHSVTHGPQEQPGQHSDVGDTLQELLWTLAGDGVGGIEEPGQELGDLTLCLVMGTTSNLHGQKL